MQEKKKSKRERSLTELEDEVERLLVKETLVLLSQEAIDRMRTHYNLVSEEEQQEAQRKAQEEGGEVYSHQSQDKVHLENLVVSIYQDDYFEPLLSNVVRETVDGEKETLEQLLNRVLDDFKKPSISWLQFLGHFSKRGRLQGYNDIDISPSKEKVQFLTMAEQGLSQIDAQKQ